MGIGLDDPAAWRGWEQAQGAPVATGDGARLGAADGVGSIWFPKARGWLALDGPLELLDPLSVLRVMFGLGAVAFTLIGCLGSPTRRELLVSLTVGACTFALWILLLCAGRITPNKCRLCSAFWTSSVALLIVVDHSGQSAAILGFLLVPSAVFVSMYFGLRVVLYQLGLASLALWLSLSVGRGFAVGLVLTLVAVACMATAPVSVLLVSRASRRSGLVDPETGLPNGLGLARDLDTSSGRPYVVAVVALAGVAECREALGHRAGADLLRRAVELLGRVVPPGARIGRVGGDEVVVVVGTAGPQDEAAVELAAGLTAAIARGRYLVGDIEVSMRAHVGLASAPGDGDQLADLLRQASLSAHRAVELNVPSCAWDGDRGAMTADDLALLASLRQALVGSGLSLAYQLQFSSVSGRASSVEALIRWDPPGAGRVGPDRFIPLAERTGLIDRLTRWVVDEALDAQVRWRALGLELGVSVNVSAKNLADPDLTRWILEALGTRGLPASCLTVEVTESAVTDLGQARAVLGPLRAHGVRISMDDFGTGFTSLSALPDLPLDELKIDQGFVKRALESSADDAIVATTCDLGHRLDLVVVAEGVEDGAIESRMVAHGVDVLQGYHLARPLPEGELLDWVGAVVGAQAPGRWARPSA